MTDLAPEGDDVTMLELERNLGVRGHDTEVTAERGDLRCTACGHVAPPRDWTVDDVRRGSAAEEAGPGEGVAAAVHCPSCGAPGRVLVPADSLVVDGLERGSGTTG
jgi:hypothetical protein